MCPFLGAKRYLILIHLQQDVYECATQFLLHLYFVLCKYEWHLCVYQAKSKCCYGHTLFLSSYGEETFSIFEGFDPVIEVSYSIEVRGVESFFMEYPVSLFA